MLKVDQMTEPPQVGRYYLVPSVEDCPMFWWNTDPYIPLFGGFHQDREIIGFPEMHAHLDWRFVSLKVFRHLDSYMPRQRIYGLVVSQKNCSEITYRKLLCKRNFPGHSYLHKGAPCPAWTPKLEDVYRDTSMTCDRCPHKGIDLSTIVEVDGIKTCPAHGLRWRGSSLVSAYES